MINRDITLTRLKNRAIDMGTYLEYLRRHDMEKLTALLASLWESTSLSIIKIVVRSVDDVLDISTNHLMKNNQTAGDLRPRDAHMTSHWYAPRTAGSYILLSWILNQQEWLVPHSLSRSVPGSTRVVTITSSTPARIDSIWPAAVWQNIFPLTVCTVALHLFLS